MRLYFLPLYLFLCPFSWAATFSWGTSCSYDVKEYTFTIPSGTNLTIDANAAIGTVLYSIRYTSPASGIFKCTSPQTYTEKKGFILESGGGPTELMSGYGLANSPYPVYKTNVPGIGVVFRDSNDALPVYRGETNLVDHKPGGRSSGMSFSLDLIKYDSIQNGTYSIDISSAIIPDVDYVVNISNSMNKTQLPDGNVPVVKVNIAPFSFGIVSGTCDTPDFLVKLGVHKLSDSANRVGGKFMTPWVDASVILTNCPQFHGIGGRSNEGTTHDNVMTVTLIPNNATTSNQGIMPVDAGSDAATGVGIQLAYGTAASPQLVSFSGGKAKQDSTMSSSQGQNYTIPLVARYIQTAGSINDITPGKANGKITYLINYN